MAPAVATAPMTTEELLALPDDGMERWLVRGELREKPMTVRNRWHSRIMVVVSFALEDWLRRQPQPRGSVLCGEAGCRLRRNPDTTVGIDVAYISSELAAKRADETTLIDGVPILVVEILSPNDTVEDLETMVDDYLAAGVQVVWVVNPYRRTVTVHRPGQGAVLVNDAQDLVGEPQLPGFRVPVAQLFE
jgi:Uma2 family endonuclease